jgi:hypothetical protein
MIKMNKTEKIINSEGSNNAIVYDKRNWVLIILLMVLCLAFIAPTYYQYYEVSRRHIDVMNANDVASQIKSAADSGTEGILTDMLTPVSELPVGIVSTEFSIQNLEQHSAVMYYFLNSASGNCEIYIAPSDTIDKDKAESGDLTQQDNIYSYWGGYAKDGKTRLSRI